MPVSSRLHRFRSMAMKGSFPLSSVMGDRINQVSGTHKVAAHSRKHRATQKLKWENSISSIQNFFKDPGRQSKDWPGLEG